jgi:hypothetical protein
MYRLLTPAFPKFREWIEPQHELQCPCCTTTKKQNRLFLVERFPVQSSSEIVSILTSAKNDSPRPRLEIRTGKVALYKCGELLVFEPMKSKGCAIGLRNR